MWHLKNNEKLFTPGRTDAVETDDQVAAMGVSRPEQKAYVLPQRRPRRIGDPYLFRRGLDFFNSVAHFQVVCLSGLEMEMI